MNAVDIAGTVQAVVGELQQMRAGADRAEAGLAAAEAAAGRIAERAARSGFVAVAVQVRALRQRIGRSRLRAAGLNTSVGQLRSAVDGVPRQGSPQQVVAVIAPVVEQVSRVCAAAAAAIQEIQEVERAAAGVLRGGQPQDLIGMLQSPRHSLAVVGQTGVASRRSLEGLIAKARQVGDFVDPSSGQGNPAGPAT